MSAFLSSRLIKNRLEKNSIKLQPIIVALQTFYLVMVRFRWHLIAFKQRFSGFIKLFTWLM